MGQDPNDFDIVLDRAGHDLRYAIDLSSLRRQLVWRLAIPTSPSGCRRPSTGTATMNHGGDPVKDGVEATYAARGQ